MFIPVFYYFTKNVINMQLQQSAVYKGSQLYILHPII